MDETMSHSQDTIKFYKVKYDMDFDTEMAKGAYILKLPPNIYDAWHNCPPFTPVGSISGVEIKDGKIRKTKAPKITISNVQNQSESESSVTEKLHPRKEVSENILFKLNVEEKKSTPMAKVVGELRTPFELQNFMPKIVPVREETFDKMTTNGKQTTLNKAANAIAGRSSSRLAQKTSGDKKIRSMNKSELGAVIARELRSDKGKQAPDKFARYISDLTNQPVSFVKECCEDVATKSATYELKDHLI